MFALLILGLYPLYIFWMATAPINPPEDKFIVLKEPRNLFENFKARMKSYAVVAPVRKLLMSLILVFFENYPKF